MGKPHTMALRQRVVAFVLEGNSNREAARHFRVSPRFVNDLIILHRKTGSLEAKRQRRPCGSGKLADQHERHQADAVRWLPGFFLAEAKPMKQTADRLVFIDETSTNTKLTKRTGWSPRGERYRTHAPFGACKPRRLLQVCATTA